MLRVRVSSKYKDAHRACASREVGNMRCISSLLVHATLTRKEGEMANEKPLDERAREAEQYALDLPTPTQPQPQPTDYVKMAHGCIHNCNACKHCDNN